MIPQIHASKQRLLKELKFYQHVKVESFINSHEWEVAIKLSSSYLLSEIMKTSDVEEKTKLRNIYYLLNSKVPMGKQRSEERG